MLVSGGLPSEIQEAYRAFAADCITRKPKRVLVIGDGHGDAFAHLALKDALSMKAMAGAAPDLRVGLVALTPDLIAVYDAVAVAARRLGLEARRFTDEEEAKRWLAE